MSAWRMRRWLAGLVGAALFFNGPIAPHAAVPWMINYQGRLTDASGSVVSGSYTLTFRLYDDSTSGTKQWQEEQSVTLSQSDNGVFSVVLGSVTALTTVSFNQPLWLSIQVADDSEMTPRQRLTATGYAMNADTLDSLDSTKFVRTDIDSSSSGKLTITRAGTAILIKPSTDPSADTAMLDVQNAAGTSEFSVDSEGDVAIAGNLAVSGTISGAASTTGTTSATWTVDNDNTSGTEPANGAGVVIEGGSGDASILWDATNNELDVNQSLHVGYSLIADMDATVASGMRIGTGSTPDNITALSDGSLFIQGDAEIDGTLYAAAVNVGGSAVGDITGVTAGTGLTGGGTSGDVTVSLSTPVSVANGGTGAATAAAARSALGAAASGANSDITSLSALSTPLSTGQGGTGAASLSDLITLATHTTGNFVATASGTSPISVSGSGSEDAALTISCPTCLTTSSGAPVSSAFLTVGNDATLTAERAITAGTGLTASDAGANSTYTFTVDQTFAPTWTGAHAFNKVNAAGGSADAVTLAGTLGAMDGTGTDIYRGVYLNLTNANHTGGSAYGIDIGSITQDAQATEYALQIGSGWDRALSATGNSVFTLGASEALTIDGATTDTTLTSGVLDIDVDSATHLANGINVNVENVSTATSGTVGMAGLWLSPVQSASGTGGTHVLGGIYVAPMTTTGALDGTQVQYGLQIDNQGAANTEVSYGLYLMAQSGSTESYGAYMASNVGIGDTTPAALLTVGDGDKFQVASTGNVTLADGVLMDLDAINVSSATEGLLVPQASSCGSGTANGQLCWDNDTFDLYIGTGSGAQLVGGATTGGGDITAVTAGSGLTGGGTSGAVTLTVGEGTAIDVNADDIAFDSTELGTTTFGAGSGIVWTFDASGGTDGTLTFGNNTLDVDANVTVDDLACESAGCLSATELGTDSVAADEIAADAVGTSELDESIAPTWTGAHAFNKVNAAGGSADAVTLAGTLGAMDGTGTDIYRGVYLNLTNANHTGGSAYGIDIGSITQDAQATEYALQIGSGWDRAISAAGSSVFTVGGNNTITIDAATTDATLSSSGALNVNVDSAISGTYGVHADAENVSTATSGSVGVAGLAVTPTQSGNGAGGTHDLFGLYVAPVTTSGALAGTQEQIGVYVSNLGAASTELSAGLYVASQSGSTNSYAAIFEGGNVGIGDVTPAALLTVGDGDKFQVASTGNVTLADGVLMDLDAINVSSATEGLLVPQASSCGSGTANGQLCWDNDTFDLYIGTGSGAQLVGGATTGGGDITAVTAGSGLTGGGTSGAVTVTVGAGTGITVNADDVAITADGVGPTQIDETAAYTWTGAHAFNKVNAAGGSADAVTLAGTLGAMDGTGTDIYRGVYLNLTNANHTGGSAYGIDIGSITQDAQATEYALQIGSGWDRALSATGNSVFTLGANDAVTIDASTTANGTTLGALDVNGTSSTTGFSSLNAATTITATGGVNTASLSSTWDSTAVVTGSTASNTFGIYNTVSKTGADTNSNVYTLVGNYTTVTNTGSTDTGIKSTYGGYFVASGDTAGTSTATGIYASALNADNNYAGIFSGGNVGIGDESPAALLTVGNGEKFQVATTGNVTLADGVLMDLDAINVSSATEGLLVPQASSCGSGTANGQLCWDNDTFDLYIGTGSGAQLVGGATTGGGDITAVTAGSGLTGGGTSGAVTVTVGAGTGITVNADDVAITADGVGPTQIDETASYTWSGTSTFSGAMSYSGSGQPKRSIILTAAGAIVSPSSGHADQRRTDGTNFSYYTLDFDKDTDEKAFWQFVVPDSFTASSITVTLFWTAASGTATQLVDWEVNTSGLADDDVFDSALGTATTINDALIATGDLHQTSAGTITTGNNGWAPGELVVFKVNRDANDATNDTLAADAKLVMVKIEWTASAESD